MCRRNVSSKIDCTETHVCVIGCLHDPANVQQTSSKCIQNAGELLDICWTFAGSCKHLISDLCSARETTAKLISDTTALPTTTTLINLFSSKLSNPSSVL